MSKQIITIFIGAIVMVILFMPHHLGAQTPGQMSYQAVIRDSANELVTNTEVGMQISILQGSILEVVYQETQTSTTNANGLVSLEIGTGTTSDYFSFINWANGPYFIKTETDPSGGTNYSITGTSQLMSVPYALHAKTAETLTGGITETDPSVPRGTQAGDMQYWDGSAWVTIEATENEGATLQMIGGEPQWVGGTPQPAEPDAPTITSVTAGDGQVDITFDAPTNDGGSTITAYTATSSPGNITGSISQAGSGTITVTGLTIDTAYTFTLTATNGVGTSSPSNASNSVTPLQQPQVGDYRDGGVVFYVAPTPTDLNGDGTLDQGLVCSVNDQSTEIQWYNGIYTTTGATATGIGSGQTNTTAIISNQGAGNYAASVSDTYSVTLGGTTYNDWFLPSKDELNKMYQNKSAIDATAGANGGSGFAWAFYWSSNEGNSNNAWYQYFYSDLQSYNLKFYPFRVRAVRAF